MIKHFEPLIPDIIRWSTAAIILSFFFSVISLILTVDLTLSNIPYLQLVSTAMSNFLFFIGTILIAFGLIPPFIRKPATVTKEKKTGFTPKYKEYRKVESKNVAKNPPSSNSFFIERDLKFLYSGIVVLASMVVVWILWLFYQTLTTSGM
ncbi:MAG: hypothetical protein EAX86_07570 [Candidatus Heimdallarchaeota archaeon]|nr:hypothetical protein [Candidatus Heimdallarchaeota archaeon]